MTVIRAAINVHRADDVTFTIDTDEFLDAIGPVAKDVEATLNETLDQSTNELAEYAGQHWYALNGGRDRHNVLGSALAKALGVSDDDLAPDYTFCTSNWTNVLSEDFGGTLWHVKDGRQFLTIESGDAGRMKASVDVREADCQDPSYVIATCSSDVMLGCTNCRFALDTAHQRVAWERLTRSGSEGVSEGLHCPDCGEPVISEVWI